MEGLDEAILQMCAKDAAGSDNSPTPHVPQISMTKNDTGAARHFQPQLLYRGVAQDLEDRHHIATQESGKTTRMRILKQTNQSNILCGKNAGKNPPLQTFLPGGNPGLALH